jgi:allantoicase
MPSAPRGMADGWETRRRRTPGHDWAVVRLGARGTITRAEVDTRHFKGNAPAACSLDVCTAAAPEDWQDLLPRTPLQADCHHAFDKTLRSIARATYVRLNIFPDGGVARLRLFGRPE